MLGELSDSFFTQYGKFYSAYNTKNNAPIPFKNHPQFPILVDILSRKDCHHAILFADFPDKMRVSFLEALLKHLTQESIPHPLRDAELIFLDIENLVFSKAAQKTIEKDIRDLIDALDVSNKYQLFALSSLKPLKSKKADTAFMRRQLHLLLRHRNCRFLTFANRKEQQEQNRIADQFSFLQVTGPTEEDVAMILRQQRLELEQFHHVLIPEELLAYSYSLSERYLSTYDPLGNALLLLDSSAARASALERGDVQFKPVLTTTMLTCVLAGWTQIPESHLHLNKFKLSEFTQGMQQRVFGQEAAITVIGHKMQQAQARLQMKTGPFCSFLFAGTKHSGKKTAARALVEQLFKQLNILYFAQPCLPNLSSILELKLERCLDKRYVDLKELIRELPYAVIMFEDIEHAPPAMLDGLHEMLTTGFLHDINGCEYNFRQAIIILSTTVGENRLYKLAKSFALDEETDPIDLMQLVMSEQKPQEFSVNQHCTPQELVDEVLPEIATSLSQTLSRHAYIVPFLPLTKSSIEKIIHQKLKILAKQLDSHYGIELSYAPEVIRYLADEVLIKQEANQASDIDKAIKQLYFCVEQAILGQVDNKNRPNQLFLQLNETGQLLRCDWLVMAPLRHHSP